MPVALKLNLAGQLACMVFGCSLKKHPQLYLYSCLSQMPILGEYFPSPINFIFPITFVVLRHSVDCMMHR